MKTYRSDLHIHTCLSPCADLEMSPLAIVDTSIKKGLDLIAVCDHNSAENAGAVVRAGAKRGLHVLPGMEINSMEEVHVLAIFNNENQAGIMQEIIYNHLDGTNNPDVFGEQIVVDEFDQVEGFNDRMLLGATRLRLSDIVQKVHELGGLSIASHIDRPSYSVISQLGFIPSDLKLDALEISYNTKRESLINNAADTGNLPILTSSDAHFPNDIGRVYTSFFIGAPSIDEILMAFNKESGRRVIE